MVRKESVPGLHSQAPIETIKCLRRATYPYVRENVIICCLTITDIVTCAVPVAVLVIRSPEIGLVPSRRPIITWVTIAGIGFPNVDAVTGVSDLFESVVCTTEIGWRTQLLHCFQNGLRHMSLLGQNLTTILTEQRTKQVMLPRMVRSTVRNLSCWSQAESRIQRKQFIAAT